MYLYNYICVAHEQLQPCTHMMKHAPPEPYNCCQVSQCKGQLPASFTRSGDALASSNRPGRCIKKRKNNVKTSSYDPILYKGHNSPRSIICQRHLQPQIKQEQRTTGLEQAKERTISRCPLALAISSAVDPPWLLAFT